MAIKGHFLAFIFCVKNQPAFVKMVKINNYENGTGSVANTNGLIFFFHSQSND